MASELTMAATGVVQTVTTNGINGYVECPGDPNIEAFNVTSSVNGDYFFSRKFEKIKTILIQNHGATLNTAGIDQPKAVVTQGTNGKAAKITIYHDTTKEVFSVIIFGDL